MEQADSTPTVKAYIINDEVVSAEDLINPGSSFYQMYRKSMPGSNQETSKDPTAEQISDTDIVEPRYDTDMLTLLLEAEPVHFRCVSAKTTDSVKRQYHIVGQGEEQPDEVEAKLLKTFLMTCNDIDGFEGTLEKASLDRESVGYCAIEVVRSLDKKIRHVYHLPANRIRALKGFRGYVESTPSGKKTFYLPFGQKLLSPSRKNLRGESEFYDPLLDGDISKADWNIRSRRDLSPEKDIASSANEILFIPKFHPRSMYYGLPDIIPAVGSVIANINIRDFFLQFFENNTVPQYAIILKGAELTDEVKQTIQQFFSREVKGSAHKTLVIPIPSSMSDNVEVVFERLSSDTKEGSFQETRKNNWNEIVIAHGVPPAVVGMVDTANLGSGKGDAQAKVYKNRVVDPLRLGWERILAKLFCKGLGITKTFLEFESIDVEDRDAESERLVRYTSSGTLSLNEARKQLGKAPVPGGDRLFIQVQSGLVYVDELPNLTSIPPEGDI